MKGIVGFVFSLLLLGFVSQTMAAQSFPQASGYVSDYAHKLSPTTVTTLNAILSQYDKDTSIQFVVVTIDNIGDLTIEEYASQLFKTWGIGQADKDNGLLLLWVPTVRQFRFEVGYGLEPDLTDYKCRGIQLDMRPLMREEKFDDAFMLGVKEALEVLGPTPYAQREIERQEARRLELLQAEKQAAQFRKVGIVFLWIAVPSIILIALVVIHRRRRARAKFLQALLTENLSYVTLLKDNLNQLRRALPEVQGLLYGVPLNERCTRYERWQNLHDGAVGAIRTLQSRSLTLETSCQTDGPDQAEGRRQELEQVLVETNRWNSQLDGIQRDLSLLETVREKIPERLQIVGRLLAAETQPLGSASISQNFERAQNLYRQAEEMSRLQPFDWLGVAELLNEVETRLEQVKKYNQLPPSERTSSGRGVVDDEDSHRSRSSRHDDGYTSPSSPSTPDFGGGSSGGGGSTMGY